MELTSHKLLMLSPSKRQYLLMKKPPKRFKILPHHLIEGEFKKTKEEENLTSIDFLYISWCEAQKFHHLEPKLNSSQEKNRQADHAANNDLEPLSSMSFQSLVTLSRYLEFSTITSSSSRSSTMKSIWPDWCLLFSPGLLLLNLNHV